MSEAKPEALVLADQLDNTSVTFDHEITTVEQAAAELRRQHEAIVALSEALEVFFRDSHEDYGEWACLHIQSDDLENARATLTKHGVKQ